MIFDQQGNPLDSEARAFKLLYPFEMPTMYKTSEEQELYVNGVKTDKIEDFTKYRNAADTRKDMKNFVREVSLKEKEIKMLIDACRIAGREEDKLVEEKAHLLSMEEKVQHLQKASEYQELYKYLQEL